MRDSNYRSITANRAAVTISTTLYDRRALDCTSDKPLVNSLNHLTFLASSSGKVRETLSNDGGLERLVDILHECKLSENNENLDENSLVAWKWSLLFQCLVLVGTRGTEAIRTKVVDAGMIPVIATVLDNYLLVKSENVVRNNIGGSFARQYAFASERSTANTNTAPSTTSATTTSAAVGTAENQQGYVGTANENDEAEFNDSLDNQSSTSQLSSSVDQSTPNTSRATTTNTFTTTAEDLIEGLDQFKKKTNKPLHLCPDHISQLKEKIELLHNIVHLTADPLMQDDDLGLSKLFDYIDDENFCLDAAKKKLAKSKKLRRQKVDLTAPRSFVNGVLIPREDDVLWSLQLLAFISKYSYLKPILTETNIISGLSVRSPPQEELLSFNGNFSNSVPLLENDDNDNDNELEEVISVDNEKKDDCDEIMIDTDGENSNSDQTRAPESSSNSGTVISEKLDFMLPLDVALNVSQHHISGPEKSVICAQSSNVAKMISALEDLELMEDRLTKAKTYIKFSKILNRDLKHESLKFKSLRIKYHQMQSNNLKFKWNYETYPYFDNLNEDQDPLIRPLRVLNIFPLVEKFTVKSTHSKEIHYWAGVIMRNSCRRDEARGGVRQCASFDCGKWEEYPRQFAKCRRCKRTKYCSKECQSTLWEYHRHWCVQTASSSSSAPSNSAASVSTTAMANHPNNVNNNIMIDSNNRPFATNHRFPQPLAPAQDDSESVASSMNTTTTAAMLRQQHLQQPLMTTPLGAFISPAQLSINNDQSLTRATTPLSQPLNSVNNNAVTNATVTDLTTTASNSASVPPPFGNFSDNTNNNSGTPVLAPTNYRGVNFGTILFHNAVHATLTATNNGNNTNTPNTSGVFERNFAFTGQNSSQGNNNNDPENDQTNLNNNNSIFRSNFNSFSNNNNNHNNNNNNQGL